jgi:hypothetical protein
MNRRDFLLLRKAHEDSVELSCEQLFMRCVDSTLDGTTAELFGHLEQALSTVATVHLTSPEWLGCDELKPLEAILVEFRKRGGSVNYLPVGAVYDRAYLLEFGEKRAVIDRAYRKSI